jgi:Flp pilus assembly protein TadG
MVRRIRGGATLPMITVLMIVMLIMAMCAVDIGHIWMTKAELRSATDAAVFAGASGMSTSPATARSRAKAAALANLVNGVGLQLQDADIELGTWNTATKVFTKLATADESKANAIRVKGELTTLRNNKMNLTFGRIFGYAHKELRTESVCGVGTQVDVVLVQDVTSSFEDELSYAKTANKGLIDTLYANGTGTSQLGIVAHTGWGKIIQSPQVVKTNYTNLVTKNTSLKLCGNTGMPVCSGTDPASGLDQAIAIFSGAAYKSTANASTPKAVVLVSDGEPNADSDGSHPGYSNSQLLSLAKTRADTLWGMKVHVYVAYFNRDSNPTAAANVAQLVRGDGIFLQTSDPAQLPTLMSSIAKKLPTQLLK